MKSPVSSTKSDALRLSLYSYGLAYQQLVETIQQGKGFLLSLLSISLGRLLDDEHIAGIGRAV
jgi:hypothetical protein